jgi:outer membrane usher protein
VSGADGKPLPAGTAGRIEGGEAFLIGYDGRAWVKGLAAENTLAAALAAGECRATFAYSPHVNNQQTIPVTCR